MTRKFLGVSDQGTLPLQLLLTGLSANDNLMGPTMGLRLADWQQGRQSVTPLLRSSLVRTKLQVYVTINLCTVLLRRRIILLCITVIFISATFFTVKLSSPLLWRAVYKTNV